MKRRVGQNQIKTFFTYDILKVIVISIIVCLILTIAFNAVEDKPSEGQRFSIIYDDDLDLGEESDIVLQNAIEGDKANAFSYEVLALDRKSLVVADNSTPEFTLKTYVEINDDDILYCSNVLAKYYLENAYAENYDAYIESALNYLYTNEFYSRDGVINEQKIIDNFLVQYKKDNRFKSKEEKENGKQLEIARIKAIYNNATTLKRVFESHPEIFSDEYTKYEWGETLVEGRFAIDLSKLTGGEYNLEKAVKREVKNEETGDISYVTSNIYLMVGNKFDVNGHLHYESLAYVVSVIKCYTNWI